MKGTVIKTSLFEIHLDCLLHFHSILVVKFTSNSAFLLNINIR
jgi:hypothetical protein